jgi:hypothetical protein
MTFEEVLGHVKDNVQEIGAGFTEPNDDWDPVALFIDREEALTVAALDYSFFSSERAKDMLAEEVLPTLVRETKAQYVAFVIGAWQVLVRGPGPLPKLLPSEHPDRVEIIGVTLVSARQAAMASAEVIRREDGPPLLSDWTTVQVEGPTDPRAGLAGRFVDPLRRALTPQG